MSEPRRPLTDADRLMVMPHVLSELIEDEVDVMIASGDTEPRTVLRRLVIVAAVQRGIASLKADRS